MTRRLNLTEALEFLNARLPCSAEITSFVDSRNRTAIRVRYHDEDWNGLQFAYSHDGFDPDRLVDVAWCARNPRFERLLFAQWCELYDRTAHRPGSR